MANADTTPPVLTSLILPTIDITSGVDTTATFTVGASDTGSGVDHVVLHLDHPIQQDGGGVGVRVTFLYFYDSTDSFSDGYSSRTQTMIAPYSQYGAYYIQDAEVYDKAGNVTTYTEAQLNALGIADSFSIVNHNLPVTAHLYGPSSITEGVTTSFNLDLALSSAPGPASTFYIPGDYEVYFDGDDSTVTNGADVTLPNTFGPVVPFPASGPELIHLPSISVGNTQGTGQTLAIKVTVKGEVFDNGSDTEIFYVQVIHTTSGTAGADTLTGTIGDDRLLGLAGDDTFFPGGGRGRDVIDGGDGFDTVVLSGARSSYKVYAIGGLEYLLGADGSGVQVSNVEQIRFADQTVSNATVLAGATPFDGLAYIASYRDLIAGYGVNPTAYVAHFVQFGFAEGRQITFDPEAYLAANPDLIQAYGDNPTAAETQYITAGAAQNRPTTFDAARYEASYPDLIRAFGADTASATRQYITSGYAEGRTATFDAYEYLASNPDLIGALGGDATAATLNYITAGFAQGRPTTTFNPKLYAASYIDLAIGYGENTLGAEQHYDLYGYREGRATSGFDSVAYLLSNPDLGAAGLDATSALDQWLTFGAKEGRTGDALFGREQTNHAVALGQTTTDRLDTPGDHDWFGLTLTAGQKVEVDASAKQFASLVSIYNANGVLITSAAASAGAVGAAATFSADHTGLYYVTIADNANTSVGAYSVYAHLVGG